MWFYRANTINTFKWRKGGCGRNHITGHSILRSAIIESAWVAARYDPALIKSYNELCRRMEPNKAIIRIARKLLNRIRYVLKEKKAYECSKCNKQQFL